MVRTRIAPSPTGNDLHIGSLYTALINRTFAHKNNGTFIVRIEDTDRTRYVEGAEERFLETLSLFGLAPDEPFQRQSDRLPIYREHAEALVAKGHAYYCFCTPERLAKMREEQQKNKQVPKYDRRCCALSAEEIKQKIANNEPHVIRMKIPEGKTTFHDIIRGDITIENAVLDDQVLLKTDGFPTYHLAVVVDDYLMKITHVIRAEEWIPSTPKHVLLYSMFGWELPLFAHLPILRNPDRSKMSKRKNPVWSRWYLDEGYLAEAILNYLALMGWSHSEGKEIFSQEEFAKVFELSDMQPVGPIFDVVKLTWMNGEYIRTMDAATLTQKLFDFHKGSYSKDLIAKTIPLIQERIKTLKEYDAYCRFFIERPTIYETDITPYKTAIIAMRDCIEKDDSLEKCASDLGMKNREFFMILRIAITGKKITPPLNESMELLGKKECIERLTALIEPKAGDQP